MPRTSSAASRGRGPYAAQACNLCRSRKTKCIGEPWTICQSCAATGQDCVWCPDRKRSNHTQMLRKKNRDLESYVKLLKTKLAQCFAEHGHLAIDHSSYLNLPPEMPIFPDEGNDAESSNDSDVDRDAERPWALKLEDSDLQLYGPTSIFQFESKSSVSCFPEIVENPNQRYVLLVNDPDMSYHNPHFDWCRHLPSEVSLTRLEHDKLLDLLFKFFTSWCLRVVPDLFLRDMYRALSPPRSQIPPKTTHYSPMLHNALVALATAFSDDPHILDVKSRMCFATTAKSFIDDECQSPSISAVHALSLLGGFHSSLGNQTLGYMYFGMSGRISQALGLSIDASPSSWVKPNQITKADILHRNWTHWTTFTMDAHWSLYVRREFSVSLVSNQNIIPFPPVDADFDEMPWYYPPSGAAPQPNYLSRTFAKTCELFYIARGIIDVVRNVLNSPGTRHNVNHKLISQIDAQLNAWKAGLPEEVNMTEASQATATPHRLMLHLTYWQLSILLHRPFYRRSMGSEKDINVTLCNTAAQHIMELVETWRSLYTLRYIPMALVQVLFSAGTVFLLSAAQATPRSQPSSDLISQVELCGQYLHEIGRSWHFANQVATLLSNLQQEKLKPKQLCSASQKPTDQPASPIMPLDPYEKVTSTGLPDFTGNQSQLDWLPTGGDPFMGGGSQMGGHLVSSWAHINARVVDSPMGFGAPSGEELPYLDPSFSDASPFTEDDFHSWQHMLDQQRQQEYQYAMGNR